MALSEPLVVPPSLLTVAQSVFTPGKTYRIRTIRTATLVASGGGTMLLATAIYPSQMSQYAALNALFRECRLHSTRIHYTFRTPVGGPVTMVSAFDPSSSGGTPASATYVLEYAGARTMNTWNTISSPTLQWKSKVPRPWSTVPSSASGSDPMGGVSGAWYHALLSAVSGAASIADYYIECDYEFRNPQ